MDVERNLLTRLRRLAAILMCLSVWGAFGQGAPESLPVKKASFGWALTQAEAFNGLIFSFDHFIMQTDFSQVSLNSIQRNLDSAWVWDQDEFGVNHIGHPYHGSFYFTSGRANGLSFYGSSLISMAGSATWELFCENETPSKNDIISTTLGGSALGEMFHRLYLEARRTRAPLAFVLSPMDGIAGVRGLRENEEPRGGTRVSLLLGAQGPDIEDPHPDGIPVSLNSEVTVEYGYPFEADSKVPYQSFNQLWLFSASPNALSFGFFSDGFLRSWVLKNDGRKRVCAGMALDYDCYIDSEFSFAANSLGLAVKYERAFSGSSVLRGENHVNWIALGASDNSILRGEWEDDDSGVEHRKYDLGTGLGMKMSLAWLHPVFGNLLASIYHSCLYIFPDSVSDDGFKGRVFVDMVRLSYEHSFAYKWYTGIAAGLYRKQAYYDGFKTEPEGKTTLNLFVRRAFR